MYQPRTYRHWVKDTDLTSFNVAHKETDLCIRARRNLRRKALRSVLKHRRAIEGYAARHPDFLSALEPVPVGHDAPRIVQEMSLAAQAVSTGPMAAVAGAIAEAVGRDLLEFSREVIVENGGDIFLAGAGKRIIAVYAGQSPLTGRIALEIEPKDMPLGVCTSSGTVGHSLSFGAADAVVILAQSAALADAAATAAGNLVTEASEIEAGTGFAGTIPGVRGALIIAGDRLGLWGKVKIARIS